MKQTIFLTLLIAVLAGCSKEKDNTPPIDPTKQYTVKFEPAEETVKTYVNGDTLHLDYYEKVVVLVDPTEFRYSWALHLREDFSKSSLNNLHYSSLAYSGIYANDWVTENLNEFTAAQKSTADVTVNGQKYVRVTLNRVFRFYNKLGTPQAATDMQNTLLQSKTETVTFSALYNYNDVFSLPNTSTATLVYTKN